MKTTLDGFGRTILAETGEGANTKSVVETEYDSCACSPVGKVKRVSQPYAPGATKYWTTYTYDGSGRTVSVSLLDNSGTIAYSYQGNVTTVTDPAGKWKKYTTDVFGNLTQVAEPNPAGGADLVTTYTYNLHDQLTGVFMPRSTGTQTRTFTYELATRRLLSATNPENGTVSYTYNADGTLATKTDAKGQKVAYTYDAYQRVTQIKRYPNGTTEDACQQSNFTYDTGTYGVGRLATATWGGGGCLYNPAFAEAYGYTRAGMVTAKSLTMDGQLSLTASYTYDNEGRRTSLKYPDTQVDDGSSGTPLQPSPGLTYSYLYDTMGRPSEMTEGSPVYNWVKDVVYNAAGQMTQMRWSASKGAVFYNLESRSYNARAQMTGLSTREEPYSMALNLEYRYSATANDGRITSQMDFVTGDEVVYAYDSLNRLISAATTGPTWGLSFGYDGFGNRVSQTVTKGSAPASSLNVDAATNRISTTGFAYDANGNLTQTPSQGVMGYDVENRLTTVQGETYKYGADNKRVYKRFSNGTEEVYFYGVGGERLGVYQVKTKVFGTTQYFYRAAEWKYFAGRRLQVTDRLGSVKPWGTKYYPYGEEAAPGANNVDKFATYWRDGTGLDYADQRYYASTLGRFLTPDPYRAIGGPADPGSWNRYAYAGNDPANSTDPNGLQNVSPETLDFINRCMSRVRS